MPRQNYLDDGPWDEGTNAEYGIRTRAFARPAHARLGGSLHELKPGSPGFKLHMHYGGEELFFVVRGHPTLRTGEGEERLRPGDVVYCGEGRAGLHTFTNPTDEPAQILAVGAGRYPDVVVYPEEGVAWVATRDPDQAAGGADPGIVARFDVEQPL